MPDRKGGGDGGDISNYSTIRGKHLFKNTVGQIWQNFTLHLNATIVPSPTSNPPITLSQLWCRVLCASDECSHHFHLFWPQTLQHTFIKLQNEVCNEKLLKINKIHLSKYSVIFLVENSCVGCAVVKGVEIFEVLTLQKLDDHQH